MVGNRIQDLRRDPSVPESGRSMRSGTGHDNNGPKMHKVPCLWCHQRITVHLYFFNFDQISLKKISIFSMCVLNRNTRAFPCFVPYIFVMSCKQHIAKSFFQAMTILSNHQRSKHSTTHEFPKPWHALIPGWHKHLHGGRRGMSAFLGIVSPRNPKTRHEHTPRWCKPSQSGPLHDSQGKVRKDLLEHRSNGKWRPFGCLRGDWVNKRVS